MKNLKLAWKMGISIGILLIIMGVQGLTGITALNHQGDIAHDIADIYSTELNLSHRFERNTFEILVAMQRYQDGGDPKYLAIVNDNVAQNQERFKEANELVARYPQLTMLKESLQKVGGMSARYGELLAGRRQLVESIARLRAVQAESGDKVVNQLLQLIAQQDAALDEAIALGMSTDGAVHTGFYPSAAQGL